MGLEVPSPAGFAQSICQRRRALDPAVALVVVEGATDRRALLPFLETDVVVVPAIGRPNAIATHRRVNSEGLSGVLVLIDCDGEVPDELKGLPDLIISANRDLEADLLLELNALRRYAMDLVADSVVDRAGAEVRITMILERALAVSAELERVRRAARALGVKTRFVDPVTGQNRKVAARDLQETASWLATANRMRTTDVVQAYGAVAGRSTEDAALVIRVASRPVATPCAPHGAKQCAPCEYRALCVGHDLVELVAQALRDETGWELELTEVDRGLRVASDRQLVADWCVSVRGRRWAEGAGVALFTE